MKNSDIKVETVKQKKLVVSELRYRRLFETAQDGILLIDFETGMILDANKFLIDLLGYSKADFLEKFLWEVGVFKNVAESKENFLILQNKGYVRFEDLPLETKLGKKIEVEFVANAYEVDDTKIIQCNIRDITDRKNAENKAIIAREQAEAIVNTVRDPLLVLDKNLRIFSANNVFYKFFKTNKNDTIGKLIFDLGNGQWNIPRLKTLLNAILPKKIQIRGFEVIHNFKNLGIKTMLLNCREITLEGGKARGIVLAIEDITGRKISEGLLSASETKYRRLFESAKDGILILDAKTGMIIDVNPFLVNLLEMSRQDFLAKKIWDLGFFKDVIENKEQFQKLQKRGYVRYEDLPLESSKGKQINVEFVSNVYNVDNQEVIQCNIRDITEREKIQKKLQESEEKFYKAFEMSSFAISISDPRDGKFVNVNEAFSSLLGYSSKEVIGHSSIDLNIWANTNDRKQILSNLSKDQVIKSSEYQFRKKNGELITGVFSAQIIHINNSPFILSSLEDISEKIKDEKAKSTSLELAIMLLETKDIDEIYSYLGPKIFELSGAKFVILSSRSPGENAARIKLILGIDHLWQSVINLIGFDPKQLQFPLDQMPKYHDGSFLSHKMLSLENGLWELSAKVIPKTICKAIEKFLGISSVYSMGFSWKEELYGGITFGFSENEKPQQVSLIEDLIIQTSITLQRIYSDNKLKRNEVYLHNILNSTDDGILAVDDKGKVITSNSRFAELWKIPQKILNEKNDKLLLESVLNQLVEPEQFLENIHSLYKSQKQILDFLNFKDGRIFERFSTPLVIDKKIIGRVWSFRDITERKKYENALKEVAFALNEAERIASLGSYTLDIKKGTWTSSKALDILFGIDSKYIRSVKGWADIVHPDHRKMMTEYFTNEVLGKHHPFDKEYLIQRKNDKVVKWVHGLGKLEFENDKPIKMIGTILDITERKKFEIELNEKNANLAAILSSIGDAVVACGTNGKISIFNGAAEKLTGYTAKEVGGQDHDDVMVLANGENAKGCRYFIKQAITTQKAVKVPYSTNIVRKDNIKVPVSIMISPIKNKSGEVIGSVGVFRNVTEERNVDKAKTEFVSLASHELRTPLATINWCTEMLMSNGFEEFNDKQQNYIKETSQASKRMVNLVNSLLNVSRLELGTFKIEPEIINIEKTAKTCILELRHIIDEKKLDFQEVYDKKIPLIKADQKLLFIVFNNLFTNAIKYTPNHGTITLRLETEDDNIKISVADNGIGIPEDQQSRIFGKLFRADNVTNIDPDGAGLGLYIVKEIIDHSGGKIWFKSQVGKGTTFYVTFPLSGMVKKAGSKQLI